MSDTNVSDRRWPTFIRKPGWLGGTLDINRVRYRLGEAQLSAIDELVQRSLAAGGPVVEQTREQFRHPALDDWMDEVAAALKHGPGLVVIEGLPPDRYDADGLRRAYFGLGGHFGRAISQSKFGERLGENYVRPDGGRANSRPGPIPLHNDPIEILGLYCIRPAASGGENGLVSSLEAWNIVEAERPEFLPLLQRGFYDHRSGEQAEGAERFTPQRVPVFGERDGLRSCWMNACAVLPTGDRPSEAVARLCGAPLSTEEMAAQDFVREVIQRPGMAYPLLLQPGEMVFLNNYEVMHSRAAFTESEDPARHRHLLRLWLQDDPPRPMPAEFYLYGNRSGLQGIDAHPGLDPTQYHRSSEDLTRKLVEGEFAKIRAERAAAPTDAGSWVARHD